MRKLILITILPIILFAGCSKDESNQNSPNIPNNVSVKVNSSINLGSVQNWVSSNTFIAEDTNEGMITGKHVGKCTVSCSGANCHVNVIANSTLYTEPLMDWGISRDELISRKGQPDDENGNLLMYETGNSAAPYEIYQIKDGILSGSGMMVMSSYTSSMTNHITDRYYPVYSDNNYYYFANAYTLSAASIIVVVGLSDNSQYWIVMYSKYPTNKGLSSAQINEILLLIK